MSGNSWAGQHGTGMYQVPYKRVATQMGKFWRWPTMNCTDAANHRGRDGYVEETDAQRKPYHLLH
jgi:hypothetical protein